MAFESKWVDRVSRSLELDLPSQNTLDGYLDSILGQVGPWSEDLSEEQYFLDIRWKEIRDDDNFLEAVLHIFGPGGEYLISVDGNIVKGGWRKLDESNTLILELGGRAELYDLAFLNGDFLILRKHGDQMRKGNKKYFVLGRESSVGGLEWRDTMELLFNLYRNNAKFSIVLIIALVVLAIIILFTIL